jgi:hypothetical protein
MTSPLNYAATVEIFESAGYYGMKKSDVVIFQQGTLPNFGFDGRILMAGKGRDCDQSGRARGEPEGAVCVGGGCGYAAAGRGVFELLAGG